MIKEDKHMKNNYIYVPGLSESVADEVKKEKDYPHIVLIER